MREGPNAVLEVDADVAMPGRVTLDGSGSFDEDGTIESYTYHVEDVDTGLTVSGPHLKTEEEDKVTIILPAGEYMATLTVKDSNGATDTALAPFASA